MKLPINYEKACSVIRREAREQYVLEQGGYCWHCGGSLDAPVPADVLEKKIDWGLFPPNFLRYPIHLQHDHKTDMTEGAVHAYCNAVLWQHYGR